MQIHNRLALCDDSLMAAIGINPAAANATKPGAQGQMSLQRIDDPAFVIRMDDHHIVHVRVCDVWTPDAAERYWRAFLPFLHQSRAHFAGYAKALIDRRGAPIMPVAMVQKMREGILEHYRPEDRLALVVDSSPLKAQIRQNYPLLNLDAFLSHDAALAWLINT